MSNPENDEELQLFTTAAMVEEEVDEFPVAESRMLASEMMSASSNERLRRSSTMNWSAAAVAVLLLVSALLLSEGICGQKLVWKMLFVPSIPTIFFEFLLFFVSCCEVEAKIYEATKGRE